MEPFCVAISFGDIWLAAIDANKFPSFFEGDVESFCFYLVHWRASVDESGGIDVCACSASGVGVAGLHLAFADMMWCVDGDIVFGCEVGEHLCYVVDGAV